MNIESKEKLNKKCWFVSNGEIYFNKENISDMLYACYDVIEYPTYREALEDLEIEFVEAKSFEEIKEDINNWKTNYLSFLSSLRKKNIFKFI